MEEEMGLFDFVKDAGAGIFGGGGMDSGEIETYLRKEFGTTVTSLKAAINEGTVRLVGACESMDIKEKVILMTGNIEGVVGVNDDFLRVIAAGETLQKQDEAPAIPVDDVTEELALPEDAVVSEFYTIKAGDSLSKIAKEFYGDPLKYTALFDANKEVIKNPDLIYPGQQIRIPKDL